MKEPENRRGMIEFQWDTDQIGSLEGYKASGSGHKAIRNPAILYVEISHGGNE